MPRRGHDEVVLVSGFPSLYATRLAAHALAARPSSFVYLVAPAASAGESARMIEALGDAGRRTCLLEGDPSAMDLGLSGAELGSIAREVDLIHHAKYAIGPDLDAKTAEAANVASAVEILELARASRQLRCLVFHSTTAVSGDRSGVVHEEELDLRPEKLDVSARTRARAEELARRARSEVPIVIVRPSRVVGAMEIDALHLATELALTTKVDPSSLPQRGDAPIHVVPMEYVTKAAHALGHMERARGQTFHLVDPHPLSARRFFDVVARAARRSPYGEILESLAAAPSSRAGWRKPRSPFAQLASATRFDARATTSALAGTGIECPPFEAYAEDLVAEVFAHLRRARPQAETTRRTMEMEVDDPFS